MTAPHLLAERIDKLCHALEYGLFERQNAIRLCLLAALAQESVFLLGPPGIGKSLIARRLKYAFKQANAFEYLMTRFSTPEEVFGPLSIQALKDEGRYLRLTAGYLPDAEVVFLDEIWKAGPAILNTLLTAINERRFRNGQQEVKLPMRLLVTASNELADDENGLAALYDRLLVRLCLQPIEQKKHFQALLTSRASDESSLVSDELQITDQEYQTWQPAIDAIVLKESVFELIYQLRHQLNQLSEPLYVSDRRWKKALRLLQASAFFNGRQEINPLDIVLLQHCLWQQPTTLAAIQQQIQQLLTQQAYQQQPLLWQMKQIEAQWIKQQNQHLLFSVIPVVHTGWFKRKANRYQLPASLDDSAILTLKLQHSLQLHDLTVQYIRINRQELAAWLNQPQSTLKGQLNGIGFAQPLDVSINHQHQLCLHDASQQTTPLLLINSASTEQMDPQLLADLVKQLTDCQQQVSQQYQRFKQHQPAHFIEQQALLAIEESFIQLNQQLAQLQQKMSGQ